MKSAIFVADDYTGKLTMPMDEGNKEFINDKAFINDTIKPFLACADNRYSFSNAKTLSLGHQVRSETYRSEMLHDSNDNVVSYSHAVK